MFGLVAVAALHLVDIAPLVLVEAALVVDARQTARIHLNKDRLHETNPILPQYPTVGQTWAYFIPCMILTGVLWYLLPDQWRWIAMGAIGTVEVYAIRKNVNNGLRF